MVRHVAVRKNCKLILDSRTKNLLMCGVHRCRRDEQGLSRVRAKSQGIPVDSDVRKAIDTAGATEVHVREPDKVRATSELWDVADL